MDPDPSLYSIGVVLCLLVLGFTSAVDASFSAIGRHRLNTLQSEDVPRATLIKRLLDDPYRFKASVLCLNAAMIITATAFTIRLTRPLDLGWRIGSGFLLLMLILVFSEAIPKSLAVRNPMATARRFAPVMALIASALNPFITLLELITRPIVRLIVGPSAPKGPLVTEEEFMLLVNVGEEEGVIEPGEREMIQGIFEFGDTLVREVMIPRMDIVALEVEASLDQALETMIDYGHSRIPVYEESVDKIVGILYIKDLLPVLRHGDRDALIGGLLRPAYFVPETMRVSDLLKELKTRKSHLAIMVDEYGGTAGLATIEDLLEEIVGDIQDESDVEESPIEIVGENEVIADARVSLADLNDDTGLALESEESDRLGGLIYEQLGRVPQVGDEVELPNQVRITVLSVEGLGPKRLRITYPQPVAVEANADRRELGDDNA